MHDPPNADRWHEIDALFQEAMDLDSSQWGGFLDQRCSDDPELHEAVRELLAADLGSGSFLEASAEQVAPDALAEAIGGQAADAPPDRTGERVGAFRIVRQLGRGGMAGVYLAERADGDFEQRVAIKFLRRGLDTEDFVRRFLAERRILSSLEHPNIARLIDGGTTERGLPYLALEYVDGVPITDFCARNRCSIDERLRLFIQVARAVQYAHASLVVHRDIKPSNILVTADGQVKLLDFGIAKLLDPEADPSDTELTRTGFRPLTPEYASPEQVRGEPITTASDVYQLGVLLYRLLTGERPYRVSGTGATLESAITSTQPSPPSDAARHLDAARAAEHLGASPARVSRRLRGDLDTIVMKALRKEPERRYAAALEMADDVQRHLDGRPIAARRESRLYRTGKFLRRHAWVAPVTTTSLLLIGAYVFTLIRHGQELEEERNVARDVQQAFVSFFIAPDSGDVGLGEGRRDMTILQAIEDGTDRVRRDLAERPAARAELFGAMAAVLEDLDEPAQAYELAVEALELESRLYGEESPQVHETLLLVGELHPDPDSGRATLERRLDLSRRLYGPNDLAVGVSLQALAQFDFDDGNLEQAVRLREAAIEIYRNAGSIDPRRLAGALAELAENLTSLDRDDAVDRAREGYEILVRELGPEHSRTAIAGARFALALTGASRYAEARTLYESSLATMDAELGPTHATTMSTRNNYAVLLLVIYDAAAAEGVYRELLEALYERYGEVHLEVASSLQNLATAVKNQGRYDEAEGLSREAYEMFLETRGPGFFQTGYPLLTIGEIRLIRGDYVGAEAVSREALELLGAALPPGHFATAVAECRLGRALAGQGRPDDARPFLESAVQTLVAGDRGGVEEYKMDCQAALEAL